MAIYSAETVWIRGTETFIDNRYSRGHLLRFDGGVEVPGSSSPQVVPLPYSVARAVDPEELFVSSLSSCHLLWFLSLAANQGLVVDRYHDIAEGVMELNKRGKLAFSVVTLRPLVIFAGERQPGIQALVALHRQAHDECFIANSVNAEVRCEPRFLEP